MENDAAWYWFKNVSLFTLFIGLWTSWTLLVRSSKYEAEETGFRYDTTTVVLLTELCKLIITIVIHFATVSPRDYVTEVGRIAQQSSVGIYFAVPALLYMLYNGLSFVNLNLFDPASFKVLINMRILFSAVLFQVFFAKRLGVTKWTALVLLMLGCAVNQLETDFSIAGGASAVAFVALQAFTSSLGGVYSEFLLKKDVDISMNVKNMYLYAFSIVLNLMYIVVAKPTVLFNGAFFHGYRTSTYLTVVLGAFCGFSTALFLRHLNIILKEYAHSGEMFLTAMLSAYLFGEELHPRLIVSMLLVTISLGLYNRSRDVIGAYFCPPPVTAPADQPKESA